MCSDGNKLAKLTPFLGPWSSCSQQCRHLEVSLSCLCIGYTHLTHGHLMVREASPVCGRCQVRFSVFYVLIGCPTYSVPRNRFFPSLMSVLGRQRLSLLLSESPTFSSSTLFEFFRVSGLVLSLTRLCVPQRYSTLSAAYCEILLIIYMIYLT